MPEYFHTRINCENAKGDFINFMNEIELTNQAKWDKDHSGKIKLGDYIGFIVTIKGEEEVLILKVEKELPIKDRESWWSEEAYNKNNSTCSTKHRVPIILTNVHDLPKKWSWCDIKKKVGLSKNCSTWMPRGTQRIKDKHLLPFGKNIFENGLDLIQQLY